MFIIVGMLERVRIGLAMHRQQKTQPGKHRVVLLVVLSQLVVRHSPLRPTKSHPWNGKCDADTICGHGDSETGTMRRAMTRRRTKMRARMGSQSRMFRVLERRAYGPPLRLRTLQQPGRLRSVGVWIHILHCRSTGTPPVCSRRNHQIEALR